LLLLQENTLYILFYFKASKSRSLTGGGSRIDSYIWLKAKHLQQGRSPYDEQLVTPPNVQEGGDVIRTGQRYDDRGHPVNSETRQRMKDHIRASNEVMQAAGIIEETADVRARDKAFQETLQRETEMGLRRLEVGRVLLVAGVWGVCGSRRRILVSFIPRCKISPDC